MKYLPLSAVIAAEAHARHSDYSRIMRNVVRDENCTTSAIHLVDKFGVTDTRATHPKCVTAVKAELEGLLSMDVLCLNNLRNPSSEVNLLGRNINHCVKNVCTKRERMKGRFIVQGQRAAERAVLVHDCGTILLPFLRIIVSLAAVWELEVWSMDIEQTYTSSRPITRDVYVRRDSEFRLPTNIGYHIVRPLNGLDNAGDA